MKVCTLCGETKSLDEFAIYRRDTGQLKASCKRCNSRAEQIARQRRRDAEFAGGTFSPAAFGFRLGKLRRSGGDALGFIERTSARSGDCWIWPGSPDGGGYGQCAGEKAHRIVYTLATGQEPGRLTVHHTCANRMCVNPEHLQLVTRVENIAEMRARKAMTDEIARLRALLEAKESEIAALRSALHTREEIAG